jgi:hypothetical protein
MTDSKARFSDRVDAYVAARPAYPDELAPALKRELALPEGATVADLGSGTGLSCVPFLRVGFAVIGVEPNAAMRSAGDKFLSQHTNFRSTAGSAEATALPDRSVDLVIAAQAAHWFDTTAARRESLRILRGPARAALIWNDRVSKGSAFAEGYEQLLLDFGTDYAAIRHRHAHYELVTGFFGGQHARELRFDNPTWLDFDTLMARLNSASYVPRPDAPTYAPMVERLRVLFEATREQGRARMDYVTRVFYGHIGTDPIGTGPIETGSIEPS